MNHVLLPLTTNRLRSSAQVFVRLHAVGIIQWEVSGIGGHEHPTRHTDEQTAERLLPAHGCPPINWLTAGFSDVIGMRYDWSFGTVLYTQLDVRYGIFGDGFIPFEQPFLRNMNVLADTLPYYWP
jgi:hypothetical protein